MGYNRDGISSLLSANFLVDPIPEGRDPGVHTWVERSTATDSPGGNTGQLVATLNWAHQRAARVSLKGGQNDELSGELYRFIVLIRLYFTIYSYVEDTR